MTAHNGAQSTERTTTQWQLLLMIFLSSFFISFLLSSTCLRGRNCFRIVSYRHRRRRRCRCCKRRHHLNQVINFHALKTPKWKFIAGKFLLDSHDKILKRVNLSLHITFQLCVYANYIWTETFFSDSVRHLHSFIYIHIVYNHLWILFNHTNGAHNQIEFVSCWQSKNIYRVLTTFSQMGCLCWLVGWMDGWNAHMQHSKLTNLNYSIMT